MKNKRVILLVLDSMGIGALPDASKFNDIGSNTLGHIDEYANNNNHSFDIPNLLQMGLGQAYELASKKKLFTAIKYEQELLSIKPHKQFSGSYAACNEISSGKDTTSGHWEMAGCPVLFDWGYFTNEHNSFPNSLLQEIYAKCKINNSLGNCHASGTEIINQLGEEHIKTLAPIFYTSSDSVFQIACHEDYFSLDKLYELCASVRKILAPYNIARVIARPFKGDKLNGFKRTNNRHDYSLKPPHDTLLDVCYNNQGVVVAIGKIADIYANRGISATIKAYGIDGLCKATINAMKQYTTDKTFIMTNLVDFDMLYGHRRDILGYKNALEEFDKSLLDIINELTDNDILMISADHGCDPSWHGSDHTREYVPLLIYQRGVSGCNLGVRNSFADIGQTIAQYLQLPSLQYGIAF